jgi:hypothetical protein
MKNFKLRIHKPFVVILILFLLLITDTGEVELSTPRKKPSSVLSPQLSERSDSFIGQWTRRSFFYFVEKFLASLQNQRCVIRSISDSDEKPDAIKKPPKKKRRLSQLDSTDVINCACGYGLEDGLMIQVQ